MASFYFFGSIQLGILAASLIGTAACSGVIGDAQRSGGGEGATSRGTAAAAADLAPGVFDPGRVVMHRLNFSEYNNTVRDLLHTQIALPDTFPPDDSAYGFDNVAEVLSVTDVHLGHYQATAVALAKEALTPGHREALVPCDLTTEKEACVTQVVNAFVPRAWRRPITDQDRTKLVQLYTSRIAGGDTPDQAMGRVLQAILLSPRFLYRIEPNVDPTAIKPRSLDGYELASRLSYFIWSSMPDDELFRAAKAGELSTDDGLLAQARRMMKDPKSAAFIQNFGGQWLSQRSLANVTPDPTVFPSFDEGLRTAMNLETLNLFREVASGDIQANQILTANFSFMNDRLAKHYGLPAVGSSTPVRTTVPPERGGLLTNASWLSVLAHPKETAPVLRGKWILSQLMCHDIPPPPPNVPKEPPAMPAQSRRERLASHRINASCASCHSLMDPLGLSFEHYDAIGAKRDTDNGVAIDTSGTLPDGRAFSGPTELAQMISADPSFSRCLTEHAFVYSLGRAERTDDSDTPAIDAVSQSFTKGGLRFPDLVEQMVLSSVFRTRRDEPLASTAPGGSP
jgi:hypothetical protein